MIKTRAPLSIKTLERAVTYQDHEDVAILHPAVQYAKVDFCCTYPKILLYIAPTGGGIASLATLQDVQVYMDCAKMVRAKIQVLPAGITRLMISLTIGAKFGNDVSVVLGLVQDLLVESYKYENSDINKHIRISDIFYLCDNLPQVEYTQLEYMYTQPYARPTNHIQQLNWVVQVSTSNPTSEEWRLEYNAGNIVIFKADTYIGIIPVGGTYSDSTITFTILSGPYSTGMVWKFKTYISSLFPVNRDILFDDYTVPIIQASDLLINVVSPDGLSCRSNCNH